MIQPRITTRYNSITQCLNMTSSLSRRCYGRWNLIDTEQYLKEHKSFSDKLKALIDSHDRLNAEKWLEEMKTYGGRPSPAVYQELVRFFAEHDRAEGKHLKSKFLVHLLLLINIRCRHRKDS